MKFQIPGAFWIALIAFVVAWLPQIVPGAPWLPVALLILGALAKFLEVIFVQPRATYRNLSGGEKILRFFLG